MSEPKEPLEENEGLSKLDIKMKEKLPKKIWVKLNGMRWQEHSARSEKGSLEPYKLRENNWCEIAEPIDIAFFLLKAETSSRYTIRKTEPKEVIAAKKQHEETKPKEMPLGVKMSMGVK